MTAPSHPPDPSGDERYFFVHVMKTAGFSLVRMLKTNVFDKRLVYPAAEDGDALEASLDYGRLRALAPERLATVRAFSGHFPYAAKEYMGPRVRTFSLFRDPVERAISHLKHTVQRIPAFQGHSLEQAYANTDMFRAFYDNLQLRCFAIESIATGRNLMDPMELGEEHVGRALERVEMLDVVGLTEEFEAAVEMLSAGFDWTFRRTIAINQSFPLDVPPELRERIHEDLALDRQFYAGVRKIYEVRRSEFLRNRASGR